MGRERRREKERTKGVENIEPDDAQPGNGHAVLENPPPTSLGLCADGSGIVNK